MRAPISVIIPTLNAAQNLPLCLAALIEGLEAGLIREVIITDAGSVDATGAIVQAWGGEIVQGAPSRGGQLRRGVAKAKGDWLLVLHADTVLTAGWARCVGVHLNTASAGYFQLRFDRGGVPARLVAGWANLRSRLFDLPYGDQGLLISRAVYDATGGYPDQPLMEDVVMARQLRGQLVGLDAVAVTSADKYIAQGWLRRGARNLWTLLRYLAGTDPAVLAARYSKL